MSYINGAVTVVYGVFIPETLFAKTVNDLGILNIPPENKDCFDGYEMFIHIESNSEIPIYSELRKKWKEQCTNDIYVKNTPYELVKVQYGSGYSYQKKLVYYVALYCEYLEDLNNIGELDINCADIIKFNEWTKNMLPYLEKPKFYIHVD